MKFFISYKHNDSNKLLVDELVRILGLTGNKIIRDVNELNINDNIPLFMATITQSDTTISIVDDNYFVSKGCMEELLYSYNKNNNFNAIFPILLNEKRDWIFNIPENINSIKKHWGEEIQKTYNSNTNPADKQQFIEFCFRIQEVSESFLKHIKDTLCYLDIDLANKEYEKLFNGLGINDSARLAEALSITHKTDAEEVENLIDRYKESNPTFYPSFIIFASYYTTKGFYKRSNYILNKIPETFERYKEKYYYLGLNSIKLNEPIENSIVLLKKGMEITSEDHINNKYLYGLLADKFINEGKLDSAVEMLDKQYLILQKLFNSNRICPTQPLVRKGYIYLFQGQSHKASELFNQIITLDFSGSLNDVIEKQQNWYYAYWGLSYIHNSKEYAIKAEEYRTSFINTATGEQIDPNLGNFLQNLSDIFLQNNLLQESLNCNIILMYIAERKDYINSDAYLINLLNTIFIYKQVKEFAKASKLLDKAFNVMKKYNPSPFLKFSFNNIKKEIETEQAKLKTINRIYSRLNYWYNNLLEYIPVRK